jgi:hypothetical protein
VIKGPCSYWIWVCVLFAPMILGLGLMSTGALASAWAYCADLGSEQIYARCFIAFVLGLILLYLPLIPASTLDAYSHRAMSFAGAAVALVMQLAIIGGVAVGGVNVAISIIGRLS